MAAPDKKREITRNFGRRAEDFLIRDENERFQQLSIISQNVTSEIHINALFPVIMKQTNRIMNVKRSTVFLFDSKSNELWSLIATGMGQTKIRIPSDKGIAGRVFKTMKPLRINNVYEDHIFNVAVDCQFGFKTENILCVPLINRQRQCIGVLEALNCCSGQFTREDSFFLKSIANYVAIAIENAKLYDNVKRYSEHLKKVIIKNESLEKLKLQLSKFVPVTIAKMAEQNPNQLDKEKRLMEVSVLFVDIQNFSIITAGYDQRMVNHMVENYFSCYLNCIHRHGGELNETSGDGLMVIFKSDSKENHAYKATNAALEMIKESNRLNREFNYPWGSIDLHIGINSGEAYVGTTRIQSSIGERWTYTASGMVTVLAARIGALSENTKLYIGPATYNLIFKDFVCEFIGKQKLKNVSRLTPVFWVKKKC